MALLLQRLLPALRIPCFGSSRRFATFLWVFDAFIIHTILNYLEDFPMQWGSCQMPDNKGQD